MLFILECFFAYAAIITKTASFLLSAIHCRSWALQKNIWVFGALTQDCMNVVLCMGVALSNKCHQSDRCDANVERGRLVESP